MGHPVFRNLRKQYVPFMAKQLTIGKEKSQNVTSGYAGNLSWYLGSTGFVP